MTSVHDIDRFQLLWRRCLLDQAVDNSAAIHQQLVNSYNEPQRVYHTLNHIDHCLAHFDKIKIDLENPDAVELAIWYHDVIYKPGATDNERLSADLFMETTQDHFNDSLRHTICQHIMATLHNSSEIDNNDTKFMVDIDLSSFGLPWPEFSADSDKLRQEMSAMSDEDYYRKQAAFQKKLMNRPRFFKSDYFYDNYEDLARQNLIDYFEIIRQLKPN
jgi:predicted metal-dependent HD superfamily phosphohydrolase